MIMISPVVFVNFVQKYGIIFTPVRILMESVNAAFCIYILH